MNRDEKQRSAEDVISYDDIVGEFWAPAEEGRLVEVVVESHDLRFSLPTAYVSKLPLGEHEGLRVATVPLAKDETLLYIGVINKALNKVDVDALALVETARKDGVAEVNLPVEWGFASITLSRTYNNAQPFVVFVEIVWQ